MLLTIRPDVIIRSARKTLSVSVDCFGRITVRAPKRCSDERIFAFLEEKQDWILQKKAKTVGAGKRLPPEDINGFTFMLFGLEHTISLADGRSIVYDREKKTITLPKKNPKTRLIKWLKETAKYVFLEMTEQKSREMGARYVSVAVTSAKSRWGSCNSKDELRYSFRLLYAPKAIVEYVIVHELAHTKHKNHSQRFWQEVAKYLPDYKARRNWLKAHAYLMHIF